MDVCQVTSVVSSSLPDCKDHSPPGSSVHGILQARILERVAMLSSRGSSQQRDRTLVSYISKFFSTSATWEAHSQKHNIK